MRVRSLLSVCLILAFLAAPLPTTACDDDGECGCEEAGVPDEDDETGGRAAGSGFVVFRVLGTTLLLLL